MMLHSSQGSFAPIGIGSEAHGPVLVCFSHLRWDFVTQRPQHLMVRAASSQRVFYFEEPVFQDVAEPRLDVSFRPGGVEVATPVVPWGCDGVDLLSAQRGLLDGLLASLPTTRLTFWYYTPMALGFSGHIKPAVCVYDCMDELANFAFAPTRLKVMERRLFDAADLVFTGGRSLYEAKRALHSDVHAFPSAVDHAHFARARAPGLAEPADMAAIPRPRVGFFGVIDERMDLDLVDAVAAARPEWSLVMVGPTAKIDDADLPRRDNIHWTGPRTYSELPAILATWQAGFMPFAMNDATRFISPTKTPEFLAAGVPVASTPIRDVVSPYGDRDLVAIAHDAPAMVAAIERLLAMPRAPWLARVDAHLAHMSWDATFEAMQALMDAKGARAVVEGAGARV